MSIKVWQTVIDVSDHGTCLVKNSKGQSYPAGINRLNKTIAVGDEALVTKSLSGEWIVIDVDHKTPRHLDITEFPKDEDNHLNWTAYFKYLKVIEDMPSNKRVNFDNYLRKKWGLTQ